MSADWRESLDRTVDEQFDALVQLRRHLHAHPEPSGEERDTTLHLYQLLGDLGFTLQMGPEGCGLIADARGSADGKAVALRADIDALRIHDAKQVDYRSQNDGVMHACGHDAHATTIFGALTAIKQLADKAELPWSVPLRGIFQPAEETCAGAEQMIDAGALENVSSVVAIHVDPQRLVGRIGLCSGVFTANCDEMHVRIKGLGGHAARPHEANDPIAAAAQLVNALYLYIPRVTDSQDAVVVTIGQIHGGDTANVIPEEVSLSGTIRSLDRVVRRQTMEHICRIASGIANATATRIDVHFGLGCHSVVNDAGLIGVLRHAGREVLGEEGLEEIERPSMGSEDFAFYGVKVPTAMIRLGCASDRCESSGGLHTPTFDLDEEAIRYGAKILGRTVVYLADPDRQRRIEANAASGTW